ncbi:MAG: zf-HC2 domain-containing protein [Proteobacteria bacterium]|nr:zf-HC2 domain-containing protein [Pseudomonadota bacterium]
MTHADVETRMHAYLEGELSLDQRALFDAHLDACPPCSEQLAELRATVALLRSLPDPEPPPTLARDVMDRIEAGEGGRRFWGWLLDALRPVAQPGVAVPVALAVTGATLVWWSGQVPVSTTPVSPADPVIAQTPPPPAAATPRVELRAEPQRLARAEPERPIGASAAREDAPPEAVGPPLAFDFAPRVDLSEPTTGVRLRPTAQPAPALRAASEPGSRVLARQAPTARTLAEREGPDPQARARRARDVRLEQLLQHPLPFLTEFENQTLAEQEQWAKALAERAVEGGRLDAVRDVLEGFDTAGARRLEEALAEAEGARDAE